MAYTTINKSTDYFNTKLYSGTGSSQNITGVGFQPDFTWIKSRSTSHEHKLIDVVRGVTKAVASDNTTQEFTDVQGLTAFGSNGYTIGTDSYYNTNGHNYASWNWKAGTGQGSSNTAGSINTTYTSVNTTAGFSISSYTGNASAGATIGHGLGAVPKFVIFKRLNSAGSWQVYHHSIGNDHVLKLNSTDNKANDDTFLYDTTPSSTLITLGGGGLVNGSGNNFICYAFAEKTGYSKFGSYVGNGNANGTFIYTGFKPAFIIIKRLSDGYDWVMYTNKINGMNVMNDYLAPNSTAAEVVNNANQILDITSNGFKHRGTGASTNGNGQNYIYMAFGQSLVGSNNVPCTAR